MFSRAVWKYIWDINMFNLPFATIVGYISGLFWGVVLFCSLGVLVGAIGFRVFKNNEYFGYYNLGYTKFTLLVNVYVFNCSVYFPIVILYLLSK